jgi:hypothetical protein
LVPTDTGPDGTRLTDGQKAWALTMVDDTPRVVALGDSIVAEAVEGTVGNRDDAAGSRLRTVGRTQVLETLAETFEPAVADDFDAGGATAAPVSALVASSSRWRRFSAATTSPRGSSRSVSTSRYARTRATDSRPRIRDLASSM